MHPGLNLPLICTLKTSKPLSSIQVALLRLRPIYATVVDYKTGARILPILGEQTHCRETLLLLPLEEWVYFSIPETRADLMTCFGQKCGWNEVRFLPKLGLQRLCCFCFHPLGMLPRERKEAILAFSERFRGDVEVPHEWPGPTAKHGCEAFFWTFQGGWPLGLMQTYKGAQAKPAKELQANPLNCEK